MSQLTRGYISGVADNSRINYCPLCRAVLGTNAYYGDGTVVCDECDFHFAAIECEEKEQDVEEETRWIPCNERLPEDNTDVIAFFYSGTVTEMRYWGNGIFQGIYEHTTKVIVAWMPLPEPYKEQENG